MSGEAEEKGYEAVAHECCGQQIFDVEPEPQSTPTRAGLSWRPNLIANDPVEPGTLARDFDFAADQTTRRASRIQLPHAAVTTKKQAIWSFFQVSGEMQVGA
jgi:hypothetical protein